MNPDNQPDHDPLPPDAIPPRIPRPGGGRNMGLVIGIAAAVLAIPVLIACAGIFAALLLPAVQAAREAARRTQCANNMKQIGIAIYNYQDVYDAFPPAYTVDEDGNPLHSWRTLILPYLGQRALYDQIDLTKPWDDPANAALNEIVVPVYVCPSTPLEPGYTNYLAVVDPSGVFSGPEPCRIEQIADGTSTTLLVTEADSGQAVPWMSPRDMALIAFTNPSGGFHPGGANCLMADASVQFLPIETDPQIRKSIVATSDANSVTVPGE